MTDDAETLATMAKIQSKTDEIMKIRRTKKRGYGVASQLAKLEKDRRSLQNQLPNLCVILGGKT